MERVLFWIDDGMSLPVRERGLKFAIPSPPTAIHGSLPVRERGLKSAR